MRHWFDYFRRSSRKSRRHLRPAWRHPTYRPNLDVLEDRCLLAAATIDPLQVSLNLPAGKTLIVPVTAQAPTAGATVDITMAPATGTTGITVTKRTGDTFLQINVSHTSSGASDPAFSGTMEFELFGSVAPRTVAYITGLVQAGFYNNLIFHRVMQNFVIQGGDPNGNGTGGPPGAGASQAQLQQLQFPDEFTPTVIFSGKGQLAMANSGNDTNGSQFFVTDGPQRGLDFNHTIFGQLVRGFDVLAEVEAVPTDSGNKPLGAVTITSAQIVQDPNAAVFTIQSTGTGAGSASVTITATPSSAGDTAGTETDPVTIFADTTNDPPILNVGQAPLNFNQGPTANPVRNLVTALNTPVTLALTSNDLEGDTPAFIVTETDAVANATVSPPNANGQFTITPNPGFTGLLHFKASVTQTNSARNNGPDSQVFTVAVGDKSITATAATGVTATAGTPITQTLTTFIDGDTTASPSDFQVAINWGDGTALDTTSGTVTGSNGQFSVAGNHTYAHGGTYQTQVTLTDIHHSPSTTTGSTLSANQQYVTQLFNDLIGKAPTAAQLSEFSGMLDQGKSRTDVVNKVLALPDYKTHVVQDVYQNMFGTGPTAQQLKSGLKFLKGDSVAALRVQLLSSDAFFKTVGGGTNAGYLNALGQELLHAPIDAATQSKLSQQLASGASRLAVLQAFVKADQQKVSQVGVDNIYQTFLQRLPTAAELSAALALTNKKRELDTTRLLTTSNEYFNKAQHPGTTTPGENGGAMAQATPTITVT
jgi:cyclophilin family peptidyl-prolyl cis-trans isomerase